MTHLGKSLISALSIFAFTEMASAEVNVTADFTFDHDKTVVQNYVALTETAKTSCEVLDVNTNGIARLQARAIREACAEDLLDKAVDAFDDEALSALHAEVKAPVQSFDVVGASGAL